MSKMALNPFCDEILHNNLSGRSGGGGGGGGQSMASPHFSALRGARLRVRAAVHSAQLLTSASGPPLFTKSWIRLWTWNSYSRYFSSKAIHVGLCKLWFCAVTFWISCDYTASRQIFVSEIHVAQFSRISSSEMFTSSGIYFEMNIFQGLIFWKSSHLILNCLWHVWGRCEGVGVILCGYHLFR